MISSKYSSAFMLLFHWYDAAVSVLFRSHSSDFVSSFHWYCAVIPVILFHRSIGFVLLFHWYCFTVPLVLLCNSLGVWWIPHGAPLPYKGGEWLRMVIHSYIPTLH
jgi:hypothetical protein